MLTFAALIMACLQVKGSMQKETAGLIRPAVFRLPFPGQEWVESMIRASWSLAQSFSFLS